MKNIQNIISIWYKNITSCITDPRSIVYIEYYKKPIGRDENFYITFNHYDVLLNSHSNWLFKLSFLLNSIHQVTTCHIVHHKIQSFLVV